MNPVETLKKIPADLLRKAHDRAKTIAENRAKWVRDNIKSYSEYIKAESEKLADIPEKAKKEATLWAEAQALLKKARFKFTTYDWTQDIDLEIPKKRLGKLYQAIGRLDPKTMCKELFDGEKGLVKVSLKSVDYPMVTVSFLTKLTEKDKCKVEKVEVPASVDYRLVCSNQ